jgi:hypothetical protein
MPGIRIRGGDRGYCVEYRGAGGFQPGCRQVAVYLDGVRVSSPALLLPTMPLRDIERLELLSPGEAGARYGNDAALGVLLIDSRTGVRPVQEVVARPPMPGFDWSLEPRPYAWARVLGSAALANVVGLGLGLAMADWCLRVDGGFQGLRTDCGAITTVAAGVASILVPSAVGSIAARWGGSTDRSRGRILPTTMLAATTTAIGYMLVVRGRTEDSGAARTTGFTVLALGTPLVLTLADRAFRALR